MNNFTPKLIIMHILTKIFIAIVAIEHIYILWLEMFAWTTKAKGVFRSLDKSLFEPTKALAANQGLYNGFLAAGLFWSLIIADYQWSKNVALFFAICVSVAGIYGGYSAGKAIFIKQGIPAIITVLLILFLG